MIVNCKNKTSIDQRRGSLNCFLVLEVMVNLLKTSYAKSDFFEDLFFKALCKIRIGVKNEK